MQRNLGFCGGLQQDCYKYSGQNFLSRISFLRMPNAKVLKKKLAHKYVQREEGRIRKFP